MIFARSHRLLRETEPGKKCLFGCTAELWGPLVRAIVFPELGTENESGKWRRGEKGSGTGTGSDRVRLWTFLGPEKPIASEFTAGISPLKLSSDVLLGFVAVPWTSPYASRRVCSAFPQRKLRRGHATLLVPATKFLFYVACNNSAKNPVVFFLYLM